MRCHRHSQPLYIPRPPLGTPCHIIAHPLALIQPVAEHFEFITNRNYFGSSRKKSLPAEIIDLRPRYPFFITFFKKKKLMARGRGGHSFPQILDEFCGDENEGPLSIVAFGLRSGVDFFWGPREKNRRLWKRCPLSDKESPCADVEKSHHSITLTAQRHPLLCHLTAIFLLGTFVYFFL